MTLTDIPYYGVYVGIDPDTRLPQVLYVIQALDEDDADNSLGIISDNLIIRKSSIHTISTILSNKMQERIRMNTIDLH